MPSLLYVLLDGVGDRPDPALSGKTPLESAHTPSLDSLASKGLSGIVHSVGKDISPESDIAVFNMLGYSFGNDYFGRGVVEALGLGLDFKTGDLALRANFATLRDDGTIGDRRAGRDLTNEEADTLAKTIRDKVRLSGGAKIQFEHTVGHRAVLTIRVEGRKLSANIDNTDPAYARIGGMGVAKEGLNVLKPQKSIPLDDDAASHLSAELVNEFTDKARDVLGLHLVNNARRQKGKMPANIVLLRDAGNVYPRLTPISKKYGLSFACLLDMPVEKGVANLTGMAQQDGGKVDDYGYKARHAVRLLKKFDAVYLHIKGPDEPGHDGLSEEKKQVIEDVDSHFFSIIRDHVQAGDFALAVSADHATPCQLKAHSADPVPLLVSGGRVKGDGTKRFTESNAKNGSLGVLRGVDVLKTVLDRI
ncbi:MAG: 2,3-bisphosphoglycerate-independent phosphoglycerate mutase [Thaumarchaeota archaeon]|nr:2,3-bisphosphoglycerate-independent phosphoglycerate mutase [Nitrososphaerota archaeon]